MDRAMERLRKEYENGNKGDVFEVLKESLEWNAGQGGNELAGKLGDFDWSIARGHYTDCGRGIGELWKLKFPRP